MSLFRDSVNQMLNKDIYVLNFGANPVKVHVTKIQDDMVILDPDPTNANPNINYKVVIHIDNIIFATA